MLIGFWRQWYKNGEIFSSGVYQDSKQVGDWVYFSPNNTDSSKITYKDGKPFDGAKIEWYANGKKETEMKYVNGQISGPFLIGMIMEVENGGELLKQCP